MLRPKNDQRALTRAMTPEINTVGLGGLGLSHSWSSLSFSSLVSPECGCFCTIRIPPAFTAGGCPAFVSSFPSGGEDMVRSRFQTDLGGGGLWRPGGKRARVSAGSEKRARSAPESRTG